MPKTKLRKQIDEFCEEHYPDQEILVFGDESGTCYDKGFLGVAERINQPVPVAVYDRDLCIQALAEEFAEDRDLYSDPENDPYTDAVEYWYFNTEGSHVGEKTPIIITRFPDSKETAHEPFVHLNSTMKGGETE